MASSSTYHNRSTTKEYTPAIAPHSTVMAVKEERDGVEVRWNCRRPVYCEIGRLNPMAVKLLCIVVTGEHMMVNLRPKTAN